MHRADEPIVGILLEDARQVAAERSIEDIAWMRQRVANDFYPRFVTEEVRDQLLQILSLCNGNDAA